MKRRHSSLPLKRAVTGQGFELKSSVKDLRAQFDAWRQKFERENAELRVQRDDLLAALEYLVQEVEEEGLDLLPGLTGARAAIAKARRA